MTRIVAVLALNCVEHGLNKEGVPVRKPNVFYEHANHQLMLEILEY